MHDDMTATREPRAITARDIEAAEDRVLADVDTFTDWLAGHCQGAKPCFIFGLARDSAVLAITLDKATVPQLVAMLLFQRADVQVGAADRLRAAYLVAQHDNITKLALEGVNA